MLPKCVTCLGQSVYILPDLLVLKRLKVALKDIHAYKSSQMQCQEKETHMGHCCRHFLVRSLLKKSLCLTVGSRLSVYLTSSAALLLSVAWSSELFIAHLFIDQINNKETQQQPRRQPNSVPKISKNVQHLIFLSHFLHLLVFTCGKVIHTFTMELGPHRHR